MFDGLESYGTHGHKLDNESDKRPSQLLAKGLFMTSSKGGYLSKFKGLGSPSWNLTKPDKLGLGFICSGPAHHIFLFLPKLLGSKQLKYFSVLLFFFFSVLVFLLIISCILIFFNKIISTSRIN